MENSENPARVPADEAAEDEAASAAKEIWSESNENAEKTEKSETAEEVYEFKEEQEQGASDKYVRGGLIL